MNYYKLLKPLLFKFPAETMHNSAIFALKNGLIPSQTRILLPSLRTNIFGIDFTNPVGLAAGFDKNAEVIHPLINQGFGFIEVGTVTPKAQPGNEKPRLFRLKEDEAIINRMGFNNKGSEYFIKNLKNRPQKGIVGANIGKNKNTQNALDDYEFLLKKVYNLCDYITINISSPNTPGLRDLQEKDSLDNLLQNISKLRNSLNKQYKNTPILLKIAPDLNDKQQEDIAQAVIENNIDGLIISNTTISNKEKLISRHKNEQGGLSGKPLKDLSTSIIKDMYKLTKGKIPIIGVGGISSAQDAYDKIKAGASLVQIYSSLIYNGFNLVSQINLGLDVLLRKDGFNHINEAVGSDVN